MSFVIYILFHYLEGFHYSYCTQMMREVKSSTLPLVKHFQFVHHVICVPVVVVSGQIVNPAAQSLTGLTEVRRRSEYQIFTSKNGSNQLVFPPAGAGLTRV